MVGGRSETSTNRCFAGTCQTDVGSARPSGSQDARTRRSRRIRARLAYGRWAANPDLETGATRRTLLDRLRPLRFASRGHRSIRCAPSRKPCSRSTGSSRAATRSGRPRGDTFLSERAQCRGDEDPKTPIRGQDRPLRDCGSVNPRKSRCVGGTRESRCNEELLQRVRRALLARPIRPARAPGRSPAASRSPSRRFRRPRSDPRGKR